MVFQDKIHKCDFGSPVKFMSGAVINFPSLSVPDQTQKLANDEPLVLQFLNASDFRLSLRLS